MKYLIDQQKEESPPHPMDTFFALMASTVKNFNLADQHFIKTKVFSLVSETEAKYLYHYENQRQNPVSYQSSTNSITTPDPSPAMSQYSIGSTSTSSSYQTQNEHINHGPEIITPIKSQNPTYYQKITHSIPISNPSLYLSKYSITSTSTSSSHQAQNVHLDQSPEFITPSQPSTYPQHSQQFNIFTLLSDDKNI